MFPPAAIFPTPSSIRKHREKVQARLDTWLEATIAEKLKPLVEISKAEDIAGLARGIAFRLRESLGVLRRETVAEEIKSLDQNARAQLRKYGVRFGAFNIYFPVLLKPAAAELVLTLWSLKNAGANGLSVDALPEPPRAGLTSFVPDPACPEAFYRAYGYHVCGPRAVRLDMLERLADLIRPLLAWRGTNGATPPKGAAGDGGFTVIPEMMSLLGCSPDELGGVLKALGFRLDRRPVKTAAATAVSPPVPSAANGEATSGTEPAAVEAAPVEAASVEAAPVERHLSRWRRSQRRPPLLRPRRVRLSKAWSTPLRWKRSTRTSGVRAGISAASAAPTAVSATGSAPPIAHLPRLPRRAQRLLPCPARHQATSLRCRHARRSRSARRIGVRTAGSAAASVTATARPASIGAASRPSAGRAATIAAKIPAARPRCTPPLRRGGAGQIRIRRLPPSARCVTSSPSEARRRALERGWGRRRVGGARHAAPR